jgi:homopolymeric O-antigen transport system permease protein
MAATPARPAIVLTSLREIFEYRSLLRDLVVRDLKVRYKRSALGIVWTMLNPLLMMIVFTLVFAQFLRFPIQHFAVYFLCAFLLWNFFSQTTSWSTACFMGYAPLLRKIYLPKTVLILATVLSGLVNLLLSLVPLALIMVVVGHPFSASIAFIPVPLLLTALFALGLSLILAPLCVMFADISQIYQVVLVAWMYLTPIFYPVEIIPAEYRILVDANPMTYFVEAFRAPIYKGVLPDAATMTGACISAGVSVVVGWVLFQHYSDRIAYHI